MASRTDEGDLDRARERVESVEDLVRGAVEETYHRTFDSRFAATRTVIGGVDRAG